MRDVCGIYGDPAWGGGGGFWGGGGGGLGGGGGFCGPPGGGGGGDPGEIVGDRLVETTDDVKSPLSLFGTSFHRYIHP